VARVAVLVRALLHALVLLPRAHHVRAAVHNRQQPVAAAVALAAQVVPLAVRVAVAGGLRAVHVEALLAAHRRRAAVDEAHRVKRAHVGGVRPAVGAALRLDGAPHALVVVLARLLQLVALLAAAVARLGGDVPRAVVVADAALLAELVDALLRAPVVGLRAPVAEAVRRALVRARVVGAGARAGLPNRVPRALGVGVARAAREVPAHRAAELADRRAANLPVAVGCHRHARRLAVQQGARLEADAVVLQPHARVVAAALLAVVVLGLAAVDALLANGVVHVPEAAHVGTAALLRLCLRRRGVLVVRACLHALRQQRLPRALGIVVARQARAGAEVAELALLAAGAVDRVRGVNRPFADRRRITSGFVEDVLAGADANVVLRVPEAVLVA